MIKAYRVWDNASSDGYATVVFAESANEARNLALRTDCCEDGEYINIRAKREKGADCLYKGKWESDWYNDETRLILVRDCGWHCIDADYSECRNCVAKEYCFETNDWILHKCDECEYFRNCDRKLDSCNDACDEFVERSV